MHASVTPLATSIVILLFSENMHFAAQYIPSLYLQGTALAAASYRKDFVALSLTEDEVGFIVICRYFATV